MTVSSISFWGRKRDRKILLMSAILENSGHKSGGDFLMFKTPLWQEVSILPELFVI